MKRIMHALGLGKIAAVDKPCQEGALAMITKRAHEAAVESYMKREFSPEKRKELAESGAALPDGSFPIENGSDLENAIRAIGRASDPAKAKAKAHIRTRAKSLDLTDKLPDEWTTAKILKSVCDDLAKAGFQVPVDTDDGARSFEELLTESVPQKFFDDFYSATDALRTSITSILQDESVPDKAPLITTSLQQFADFIEEKLPDDIGKSLAAGFAAIAVTGDTMTTEAIKKALGLAATATDAEVLKAAEDKAKKAEEHEKAEKRAEHVAKMSDKHKAFAANPKAEMPKGGKSAFEDMEPGERDDHMAAHPIEEDEDCEKMLKSGTAFRAVNGMVVTKRQAGAMFDVMKAQNDELAKAKKENEERKEREEVERFAKRATDLGFAADFGTTMRKAYSGDAAAQALVEKELVALRKQAETGGVFGEIGKSGGAAPDSGQAEFEKRADELQKANPNMKRSDALTKAYSDPAIKKRLNEGNRRAA